MQIEEELFVSQFFKEINPCILNTVKDCNENQIKFVTSVCSA